MTRSAALQRLEAPYRATRYRVFLPTATDEVRIGQTAPAVDDWLALHGSRQAAIVTACNPRSLPLGCAANRRLQAALLHLLHAMPHPMLPACNTATTGAWPDEHSLIVADLTRGEARRLGARFHQNAVVWIDRGRPAQLLWIIR
ncbi:DUF3293 domain-containing protein [Algiphilus sp.]|uniref:DUF3293 domain-containing protein n=1 Tax=Algiphilus sp. TaxID=1872431 RepID=UPI003B521E53